MSVWRARLDGVNEQDRRYAYKAWSRSEDVEEKTAFNLTWIKADWVSKPKGPDGMAGLQVERKRVR